jgi:hypothetical protein
MSTEPEDIAAVEGDNCPHCGAIQIGYVRSGKQKKYKCGSWIPEERAINCYESELSALRTALEDMTIQRDMTRRDVAVLKTKLHRISGKL